jgi:hypothetical protein
MAQGPWRCSQCGTINEPVANSCRTCGKWPSLFDLEDSTLDEAEQAEFGLSFEPREVDPEAFEATTVEVATYEPPPAQVPVSEPEPEVVTVDDEYEEMPRRHRWTSAILPIAILVYFVVSAIVDR